LSCQVTRVRDAKDLFAGIPGAACGLRDGHESGGGSQSAHVS
jgi:hypothetical protein